MADTQNDGGGHDPGRGEEFTITVNENAVPITGHRHTGQEIKQAAINAGVKIDLDFVLSEETAPGKMKIVGDNETVTLNKNSRFEAIPNDDHS